MLWILSAWGGVDMPAETHCLHEFAAILQGTSKHIQFELRHKGESKYVVEILKTVLGTEEEVKKRKIASVLYCPVSPLTHDDSMLDAYLELSEYDVPVNIYPCPIVGLAYEINFQNSCFYKFCSGLSTEKENSLHSTAHFHLKQSVKSLRHRI